MNCVVQSVKHLFPELNLEQFVDKKSGYSICDIQRMIPDKYTLWILLSNYRHISKRDFDNIIISFLLYDNISIPMFMFTKTHCFLVYYKPSNETFYKIETDKSYHIKSFFESHLIYQIACVTSYDDYSILVINK